MELGYLNARVRAWKSGLFSDAAYEEMVKADGIGGIEAHLRRSAYWRDIEICRSRFGKGEERKAIIEGLKENLSRALDDIWAMGPEPARRLMRAFIAPWEVYNLKVLLRGVEAHVEPEEVYAQLSPVGEFDTPALKELSHQNGVKPLVEMLTTWGIPYGKPLKAALSHYEKEKSLFHLEVALDSYLYPSLLEGLKGRGGDHKMVRAFLSDRIDLVNLLTTLKLAGREHLAHPHSLYFVPGGRRLDEKAFTTLFLRKEAREVWDGLLEALKDGEWRRTLDRIPFEDQEHAEERCEGLIMRGLCRCATQAPLSIAVPFCYIYRKYREVKRLRFLTLAKEFRIPEHEVRGHIFQS